MSKSKKKLIPELRFPEFINDGEWRKEIVSNYIDFQTGYPFKSKDFTQKEQGLRLIKNRDLKADDRIVYYTGDYDDDYIVNDGDILVGMDGDFTPIIWTGGKALLNQRVGRIQPKKNTHLPFFHYFLFLALRRIESITARTTVKHLSHSTVEKITEPLPKQKEQQKIAACLSSLDELLTAHKYKLTTLQRHKKGLLQNLFPQEGQTVPTYRFNEFEGDGEWVENPFDKLFKIGNGRDYKHLNKGDIPVYGSGGLMLFVDDYLYEGESVCIGRKGTIDNPIFLTGKFWTVDTLFYTYNFGKNVPKFIFYLFQNINWLKHNQAGGVPSLSKKNLYRIKKYLPKPKEQQKIAACLSAVDDLITAQQEKIDVLELHKKGLLQGLFPRIEN